MNTCKYIFSTALLIAILLSSTAIADTDGIADELVVTREVKVDVGYQSFSLNDNANRAGEYTSFDSSPTFGINIFNDEAGKNLHLEAEFLNEDDYNANINYSHKDLFKIELRTERFFHNLDHIPYNSAVAGSRPDGAYTDDIPELKTRTFYSDNNTDDRYGIQLNIDEAKFRIKHPTYPAHVNLAYWRYEKKGQKQMRFVGESCATACHMQSKTRKVNKVTEELKVGVDAHVGLIDIALESLHRTFRDKQPIEQDTFDFHLRDRDLTGNPFEHSEDPDSKVTEFSIKANTAPSGGLVGSTSLTIGKRENRSKLTSVGPVYAETDYYKAAADVTYTPGERWTFNLRYRLLDMESDNTDQFIDYDNSENPNPLDVRNSMDIRRAWYEMIVNYRPTNRLTFKGELRREDIHRTDTGSEVGHDTATIYTSNTADPDDTTIIINPNWQLPEDEIITKAKLGFHSRMLEKSKLKFSGWMALEHSDDPAYGTSYGNSQQLFLSSSYNPSPFWGVLGNIKLLKEENKEHQIHGYDLDREKQQQNVSIGSYFTTDNGLSFNLNYGYLHTNVDQGILFGSGPGGFPSFYDYGIPDYAADYDQTVHTISASTNWQILENLNCGLEAYHIRSKSRFSPDFATIDLIPYDVFGTPGTGSASSDGLSDISRVDIRQNGIKGRVNWQLDDNWSCSIQATYDKYDDVNSNDYDGSAQTAMVSFSRTW